MLLVMFFPRLCGKCSNLLISWFVVLIHANSQKLILLDEFNLRATHAFSNVLKKCKGIKQNNIFSIYFYSVVLKPLRCMIILSLCA